MSAPSLRFAAAARALGEAARRRGLQVPGFRSPPRRPEVDRTIRRAGPEGTVVAVRIAGRPWVSVLADMIDGVVVVNALDGPEVGPIRDALWAAVEADVAEVGSAGDVADGRAGRRRRPGGHRAVTRAA